MTSSTAPTTTIDRERDIVTLINTFTLRPEHQQTFIETQRGEYQRLRGQIRGGLVANLHRGWSGRRAINYAQFRELGDVLAWQSSDLMKHHRTIIDPFIERAAPALFRVAHVASSAGGAATIAEGGTAVIAVMAVDPAALEDVVALQRDAAEELARAVPGVRAVATHRSLPAPGPGPGPGANAGIAAHSSPPAAGGPPRGPSVAVYAVVEDEQAARALMEHARYRAAFTAESPHIRAADAEIYTVFAVEPG